MRELTDAGMYSYDREGALVGTSDVLRYVTVTSCPLAIKTNDLADQTKAQQHKRYFSTTTDHAWEIHWLEQFFEFLLDSTGQAPNTLTCDYFKKYFFQKDNSGSENRLAAVFNSLPSEQWMGGFALMTHESIYLSLLDVDKVVSCNDFDASGADGDHTEGSGDTSESDVEPLSVAGRFLAYSEYLFNDENDGIDPQSRTLGQRLVEATVTDIETLKSNGKYTKLSEEDKGKSGLEEQEAILKMIKDLGDTSDPDNRNWGVYFDTSALADEANKEAQAAEAASSAERDNTGNRMEKRQACALPSHGPSGSATASRMRTQGGVSASSSSSGSAALTLTSSSNSTVSTSTSSANSDATSPTVSASSLDSISASSTNSANATASMTNSLSSPVVTSGAPITSCALRTLTQYNSEGHTASATQYCDCNDGWTASCASVTGADFSTTYNCAVGNDTTIGVSTSPPLTITSCALVESPGTSALGSSLSASHYCSCNDELQADLGSTVGSDGSTTFTCDVGTETTMAMSTAPPSTSATTTTEPASTTSDVPEPTESCHTQYKVFYDTFSIYGHDWDAAKLDGDGGEGFGSGLHHELSGCADVTKWKFETLDPTEDSPFTFHASGHITIWQKSCIEHAITSAGAPAGHCSGSG
ncbi:hypothetical protein NU219Hw_g8225t1 [Hortaea werneckii]